MRKMRTTTAGEPGLASGVFASSAFATALCTDDNVSGSIRTMPAQDLELLALYLIVRDKEAFDFRELVRIQIVKSLDLAVSARFGCHGYQTVIPFRGTILRLLSLDRNRGHTRRVLVDRLVLGSLGQYELRELMRTRR